MRGLEEALDRRLRTGVAAPLATALSGGGDSLALLLAAKRWADAHGRRVLALTVDHGLNPDSAAWTARCAATAARLGVDFQALPWTGDKPSTGLPAAARAARHALLADAARAAGASVILMGHTADDLAESAAMRAEGSTVSDAAEWSPSPAWPEGRGVFLLRPMLGLRRAEIRAWLSAQGETWIDDPANADLRYARARARSVVALAPAAGVRGVAAAAPKPGDAPRPTAWAGLSLPADAPASRIAAACLCAAGTTRPPRGERLERLVTRLRSRERFAATLAGARVESDGETALFMRDFGRTGLPVTEIRPGEATVWDGRFEIETDREVALRPLAGLRRGLPRAEQAALRGVPAAARPTLPVAVDATGAASCPILAADGPVRARALSLPRFEAATGFVDSEPVV